MDNQKRVQLSEKKQRLLDQWRQGSFATAKHNASTLQPFHRTVAPLSFAQEQLWSLCQLMPAACYNVVDAVRLRGVLNQAALTTALSELAMRHDMLRMGCELDEQLRPLQRMCDTITLPLETHDLRHSVAAARTDQAGALARHAAQAPFDLTHAPLWRALLLQVDEQEAILVLVFHHLIADGWSLGILRNELFVLYDSASAGRQAELARLELRYSDYAIWQRGWFERERMAQHQAYWDRQLRDAPAVLDLPFDRPRAATRDFQGAHHPFTIPVDLYGHLRDLCHREHVTLFVVGLAAYALLLSRYSNQDDIVIGTAVAGRMNTQCEAIFGNFINMLALRIRLGGGATRELLQHTREVCLDGLTHQEFPFEKLVELLQPARSLSHAPVFQVSFALQSVPLKPADLPGLAAELFPIDIPGAKYDLSLAMQETATGLQCAFEYDVSLFNSATIAQLARHYQQVLWGLTSGHENAYLDLPLLDRSEQHQILRHWNDTQRDYLQAPSVHRQFERCVTQTPNALAIVSDNGDWSYAQLNQRANQCARYIYSLGVRPGNIVGVYLDRSLEMIVALLGVLKAGAAYLPLDPVYPIGRMQRMLRDGDVNLLITRSHLIAGSPQLAEQVMELDRVWQALDEHSDTNLALPAHPEQPAYLMYTSGSTGQPKGVVIPHRGIMRLVLEVDYIAVDARHSILQLSSLAFDAATLEIWGALLNGARCVLLAEPILSPQGIAAAIRRHKITHLVLTTALFNMVAEELPTALDGVQQLVIGGEIISPEHVERVSRVLPNLQMINAYGPTEATTIACTYAIPPLDAQRSHDIPIGRPISNTAIYILDPRGQPAPVGVPGTLYIGGAGLAIGYYRQPALTASQFVPDPFGTSPGARLYHTGDMARWRADGMVEFLGRRDQQVKIRGFRIETSEIEAALRQHPDVRSCVVIAHDDASGGKILSAYVVLSSPTATTPALLREMLRGCLPSYMLPAHIVALAALPLTSNGKVDRRVLPPPDTNAMQHNNEPPRNALERDIAAIWGQIMQRSEFGVHDNFFALGGHSILMIQVITRMRQTLQPALPLTALFDAPTIAELAVLVENSGPVTGADAVAAHLEPIVTSGPASSRSIDVGALSDDDVESLLNNLLGGAKGEHI